MSDAPEVPLEDVPIKAGPVATNNTASVSPMKASPMGASSMDSRTVNINRLKLIAIFAVAVVPVVMAFTMYYGGMAIPDTKTNKGNLIWPPITTQNLDSKAGLENQVSVTESILDSKKWTLMVTGEGDCTKACKDLLHTVRQVNVSMSREMERVNRVLVSNLNSASLAEVEQDYPHLVAHHVMPDTLSNFKTLAVENGALQAEQTSHPWMVWVVDPLGNVMLQYTAEHDGYDMIADLKRLLKLSKIG